MHMSDGLAAVGFAVDDEARAFFGAAESSRQILCLVYDLPQESRVLRGESSSSTRSLNSNPIKRVDPVFWIETLGLFAFAFSWLVKGEVLLKD